MMCNPQFFKAGAGSEYAGFDVITHEFIIITITYAASAAIAWDIDLRLILVGCPGYFYATAVFREPLRIAYEHSISLSRLSQATR
jgi:hypothetical protein